MKKISIFTTVLLICLMLLAAFPAYADGGSGNGGNGEQGIQPRWTEISIFPCSITRKDGLFTNAHVLSSVTTYSVYSKIELAVTIQEKSGSSFVDTSHTWSFSGNGYAGGTKDLKLPSGVYRVKAVAVIYSSSGQYIETVTNYSTDVVI